LPSGLFTTIVASRDAILNVNLESLFSKIQADHDFCEVVIRSAANNSAAVGNLNNASD